MIFCLKWTLDEGSQAGSGDFLVEELGLVIRGVRFPLALNGNYPEIIALPEPLLVPMAGDRLVLWALCVRAIDRFEKRQADEELAAREAAAFLVPGTATLQ